MGKLILLIIPLAALVAAVGELIASIIIDQIKVPEKAYTGYGIPVSVRAMVPEAFKKIQTPAVASGVIKSHNIPK